MSVKRILPALLQVAQLYKKMGLSEDFRAMRIQCF